MTVDTREFGSAAMSFEILRAALGDGAAARLGRLAFAGRRPIDTPNFIGITSRGAIPHITPDNVARHLNVGGAYMALEDFIERPQQYSTRTPPIYEIPPTAKHQTRLHSFTAMPPSVTTVLGARRLPAVASPMGNTKSSVSVFTSTGFQALTTAEYLAAAQSLQPDIAVPPADLTHSPITPNSKRALRMAERTDEWLEEWFSELQDSPTPVTTFAPVLPIPYPIQWEYLSRLAEDYLPTAQLAGLALYDPDLLPDLASFVPALLPLPRLSLSPPSTPHHILNQIALGIDLLTIPFINTVSDAGLALAFTFPPPTTPPNNPLPLALDLTAPRFATSLAPLTPHCPCGACTTHHAAYIHHLLAAREMLGWTLLQAHNHGVMAAFFAGVRATLAQQDGAAAFARARGEFARAYEAGFPLGMGERPCF
ncbi:tRNA-guanine transglycosylase [Trichocladium antarcticum]|uniref:Queuine tRNA-ribosyltransferase accessory subunit 2 n=1 Tax=Trichocladium antarcticum TaxID=1450529 RepID=A0AAN6USS2_9PEZI|nr:tRNA-guanine transglycosylase [Trichocladium antarcticum]